MNNKFLAILVSLLTVVLPISAATTTNLNWDGAGSVNIDATSDDDAVTHFDSNGNYIKGEWHLTDFNNNPYSYGVDDTDSWFKAQVTDGNIYSWFTRSDSYEPMYGASNQHTETGVWVYNGNAEMAFGERSNYASLGDCQYSRPKTTNSKQIEATADYFELMHLLSDSDNDGSVVSAYGSGNAQVKLYGESSQDGNFNMGFLPCCGDGSAWNNNYARYDANGVGNLNINAWADNQLTIHNTGLIIPGDGSDNSATYNLNINYAGNLAYTDFGVKGN